MHLSGIWKRRFIATGLWLFLGAHLLCAQVYYIQPKANSPYSRFGLGDPADQFYAAAAGMAGLGASYNDYAHLNLVNPASLGWLQVTAFELGVNARYSGLRSGNTSSGIWSGNLNYMSLAFPIKNPINQALERSKNKFGWGMAVALRPFTNVGYNVESVTTSPDFKQATTSLKGSGGTYKLSWTNGIRYGGLAVGADAGFVFGKITNSRRVTFDSLYPAYSTELPDEISITALQYRLGAQYTLNLEKKSKKRAGDIGKPVLTAGVFLNNSSHFTSNSSRFYYRDNLALSAPTDTFLYSADVEGKGVLPREIGFGLTFEKREELRIGVEYYLGNWSAYSNEARPEQFMDTRRFLLALEFTPDISSYNNYFARLRYRAGFFYGTDPRSVNEEQLLEYGITLGTGFPIFLPRQTTSYVNLALRAGRFGLPDSLKENFVQLNLGFTLNDNSWFFKRKFN